MKALLIFVLSLLLNACGQSEHEKPLPVETNQPEKIEITPEAPAAELPKEEPKLPVLDFTNLSEAITQLKPTMGDFVENEISTGAALLAFWASEHLTWTDLSTIDKTKYKLVMKDPDAERGKQLCTSGNIVEIQVDNSMPNGKKIFVGGMYDQAFNIYRFIALGSTGELVSGSKAKFCGIITGKNDYSNSQGGAAHAVHLIGMFDLPENR